MKLLGSLGLAMYNKDMNLLEVRDLRVAAEGREILHGVDIEINAGETVLITGKNGAGKSTLARAIAGLLMAEGEVVFEGKNITNEPIDARARKGIFLGYQAPVEIPGIDVAELLQTALEERGEKLRKVEVGQRIAEAADRLKMDVFMAGRSVNVGFSGGERKKNEILQMMVLRPKLAILDEIDSGLDKENAKLISEVLAEVQRETGLALMLISHNKWVLENLKVTREYHLDNGRIE